MSLIGFPDQIQVTMGAGWVQPGSPFAENDVVVLQRITGDNVWTEDGTYNASATNRLRVRFGTGSYGSDYKATVYIRPTIGAGSWQAHFRAQDGAHYGGYSFLGLWNMAAPYYQGGRGAYLTGSATYNPEVFKSLGEYEPPSGVDIDVPLAALSFSALVPTLDPAGGATDIDAPAAMILFSAEPPGVSLGYPAPSAAVIWSALAPALYIGERIPASKLKTLYIFTLTGAPDGTTDIEIPIKSFQGRIRQATPTYLSAVIPGMDDAAAITARANGEMVVEMVQYYRGALYRREEIARATLGNIMLAEGAMSKSITLVGHKTETFTAKAVTLEHPLYYGLSNGKKRYRFAAPDLDLRPGDTVTVGSDVFTAGMISFTVSPGNQTMEVSEAED